MKKFLFVAALLLVSGSVALASASHFSTNISNVSDTKATLTGYINGCCDGYDDDTIGPFYYFEYGTTTSVSNQTENLMIDWLDDTNEPAGVANITIINLRSDTKYYYRFVQKIGNENDDDPGFTYTKTDLKSFRTLDDAESPDEDGLTEEQIEGLEHLGFTQVQINMIIELFEEDGSAPDQVCYYGHTMTLRQGMAGEHIRALQLTLRLHADGNFGPLTRQAVMRFQAEHGLTPDGVVGRMTGENLARICLAD